MIVGALIAEDLGSANGLFEGDSDKRSARLALDGDRPIRIGRTYLRVREASYAVAAGAPACCVDPRPAGGSVAEPPLSSDWSLSTCGWPRPRSRRLPIICSRR